MQLNYSSKAQISEYVNRNRLYGVMNTSKWNRLFESLADIDELITFKAVYIDGFTWPSKDESWQFTPELEQIWGNFAALEYLEINTQVISERGALISPQITDYKSKVATLCSQQKVKYSFFDKGIRVWGYFRHGQEPELIPT